MGVIRLDFASSELTSIPAELGHATSLQSLILYDNQLSTFPAEISQARGLRTVFLGRNALTAFPAEMGQARSLQTLELRENQLTSFPAEMGQAHALQALDLTSNRLESFPAEMGQAKALRTLLLNNNLLSSFPAEIAQAQALQELDLGNNRLTGFPAEMGNAKALRTLNLSCNRLESFPAEMGQAQALKVLNLNRNRLASFPKEMGHATALQFLRLSDNRLSDLPIEIAQLSNLRFLDLSSNRFTTVPGALLELPEATEIDLRHNPIPEAEILAVRERMAQRLADGQTVPQLLLPQLAAEVGELREAAVNQMNVHTTVLTAAFQNRLNEVALQFPQQLCGSAEQQRAELGVIAARLTQALDEHATQHAPDPEALHKARQAADLMFQKGQGAAEAFHNEFDRSTGHVLAYTFLAIEAQVAHTPEAHRPEATRCGMARLIGALENGSGNCDTRLCEEVMQVIGLPLSDYAQQYPEVVNIAPPRTAAGEAQDVTLGVAKTVLRDMVETEPGLIGEAPSDVWRARLLATMQHDHPGVAPEQVEQAVQTIESAWQEFRELVDEQRAANG